MLSVEQWDATSPGPWEKHVDGADAIINLTGELISGKRWTAQQKEIILNSRVSATLALVNAIGRASKKPSLLINFSAVGYYGNVPSGEVPESLPPGDDFLAVVCQQSETAAQKAEQHGVRVVTPRIGIVLGEDGGALKRLLLPFKIFAGGYLGTGQQWMPWIHRDDLIRALAFIIKSPQLNGAVNFAAHDAVNMKAFCKTLGKVLGSPSWTFVPAFILRLGLGEMADMLLTGQRVIPKYLLSAGFTFNYPTLKSALKSILEKE
jgi:uncharacterized protein (TIGR01777 family)